VSPALFGENLTRKKRGGLWMKKPKSWLKGFIMGLIIATVTTSGITVWASVGSKMLTANFNNIRLFVDGELIIPKDGNGKEVEPFIVDGTTYLPVRAVANALNKDVTWDGNTQTVYIGKVPGQANYKYMFDVLKAYESYGLQGVENAPVKMLGDTYEHSVIIETGDDNKSAFISYNLKGQYKTIHGYIGSVDGYFGSSGTLSIELDGKPYMEYQVEKDMLVKEIVIDVTGVKLMKIKLQEDAGRAYFGFGNVTIE